MTRRTRAWAALPAGVLLAGALLAGCGQHDHAASPSGTTGAGASGGTASTAPAPSASGLAHMQRLVDEADSAAASAEKDAAGDK